MRYSRRRRFGQTDVPWEKWPRERLMGLRLCDLGVKMAGTWVETCIERLYAELQAKGIRLRPHVWLSEEWLSPGGVPGVAVPFYLVHPRLIRLERRMMLEVEGGTPEECMKLLRHETGHAIEHAFNVHRKRLWREHFGRASEPYPDYYRPNPASRRFVHHLDGWYAQSHPEEDFAETFAVWLQPRSGWRRRYAGWPALKKLKYVDQLMKEIGGRRSPVRSRATPYALGRLRKTLRQYYEEKREWYGVAYSTAYDPHLRRLFSPASEGRGRGTAAAFIRRNRRELRRLVCEATGEYQFTVDHILKEMTARCQELGLRAKKPERDLKLDMAVLLTVQTMRCLYRGSGWHAV